MDAKESRTNPTLSSSISDGSIKYAHNSPNLQTNRSQSYHDIDSNSLGKLDATTARPCAIIGPDRVLPSNSGDVYLKKTGEPWPCQENIYRHTTDYPNKISEYQPNRNISPRQTFQENMQRIMVPPTYSSIKIPDESSSKNTKLNMPQEAKYCDVPYNNPVSNELKSVRNSDIPMTNMNPAFGRSVPPYGWPPGVNVRPLRPYGAPEFYQYSEYPSCAGPRPMQMVRQHQTLNGDAPQVYPDHLYQEANIRFKPYPLAKERHQQIRYDYISNYPNTFHPPAPFPPHRYDLQKSIHGHPYPVYPQIPVKYLDRRIHEPLTDSYQRSPNLPNINMAYRNQTVPPTYGPLSGNCPQNKSYSEGSSKPSKLPFESNSKVYVDLEPKHSKGYPIPDNLYLNEMNHSQSMRGDILLPPHATLNMHAVPQHAIYRKDNAYPKNFEYNIQCRNFDQSMNNSLPRFPLQYSPNTLAISPSDSNTSNDTAHTLGTSQEDCGYASQSSTTSVRSLDSYNIQATNDAFRRHNYNSYGYHKNNTIGKDITPKRKNSSSDKKNINVRQFLQMWNEGDDDVNESNKDTVTTNNSTKNNEEQLYVLGSMPVPSNEIGKYEHIQKISKLPENIKGYNSLELLNQYEELLEPCKTNKYANKPLMSKQCNPLSKNIINKEHIVPVPRPVSPLDVEAKISQSVIHKEVGCNFEIKPCSPEMLNVEVATPVQNILGERTIEKVINPVITHTPILQHSDEHKMQNLAINNASCKMTNHPYIPDHSADKLKPNNYSVQDLETNSGVCLASLPQLDNDIELNFPEINQQFINANKKGSNIIIPSNEGALLDADQNSNFLHEKSKYQPISLLSPQMPLNSGTEREVSKLSKYRKNRRIEQITPSPKDFSQSIISSAATQRIDSVIIKNPDNIKLQELQDNNTNYVLNTLLEDNNVSLDNNTLSLEKAIDFSLNKIEDDIPIDEHILNIKHSDNNVLEDHCNEITEYDNLNTAMKKDGLKSTSELTEVNGVSNNVDHMTTSDNMNKSVKIEEDNFSSKLAHDDQEHYEFIRTSEKISDDVEIQQEEFPMQLLQNNVVKESCHHTSKSGNTSEDIEMKQDSIKLTQENDEEVHYLTTSDNVTEGLEHEPRNSVECHYNASKNVPESIEMVQEKLVNVHHSSNPLNLGTSKDILSHVNTNISAENFNSALLTNCSAMSVIHVGEALNKVTSFCEMQTSDFGTNNHNFIKGNDVSVIKKNEQILPETTLEDTNQFTGISLPILENIPDNKPENIENNTVNITNEINSIGNDNICSAIKEEISNIVHKDDVDSISAIKNFIDKTGNSTDTNVLKTVDVLEPTLNIHSMFNILTNCSETDKISNTCSVTKSEEDKDEITETVKNEESVVNEFDCSTNNIQLSNNTSVNTAHSEKDEVAEIEISKSQKLLGTSEYGNENNDKEEITTNNFIDSKSERKELFSFRHRLPSSDKSNTNSNSVINEMMHETTAPVKNNIELKYVSEPSDVHSPRHEDYEDNVIHNDVENISPLSPTEKKHIINSNSKELNISVLPNQNTGIIKEVENHIIITKVDTDENNELDNPKLYTNLTENRPCSNKTKVPKELFSPWIQKLMTHTEGIYKSYDTSNKEVIVETIKDDKELELTSVEIKQNITEHCKENITEDTDKLVLEKIGIQQNMSDTKDATLLLVLSTDKSNGDFIPCNKVNECESIMQTSECEGTTLNFEANLDEIVVNTKLDKKCNFFENNPQRVLKRSLSESALHNIDSDSNVLYPTKRRKENDVLESNITAEDICKIVQNNRRNSVSTFYNEENVYILIDNDLIISEESVDSQKICYADTGESVQDECAPVFDKIRETFSDPPPLEAIDCDIHNASTTNEDKCTEESWVEDVACIETVFSDDVAEDITIDETMSPKLPNEEDDFETENDDSFIYQEMCESDHINKLRNIYGNSVSNENVQLLETLYRTPQMDVNKTLDIESHNIRNDKSENDDFISERSNLIDDKENLSNDLMLKTTDLNAYNDSMDENNANDSFSNEKSVNEVHSCETRNENCISNSQKDNSHYSYSSSPEVSSTTPEEKSILLKITSYNGSRSSQINEISADDINKISYKLTENKEYRTYKSNFSSTKTLITKAAQKYIPPLIETIGDLKVKLPLPQHRLNKLKQLKKSKIEPKISQNIRYKNKTPQSEIPKKPKPKFEDVLKSIDEVQFKKRKDKIKKIKVEIPKVVIKKSEDGAHYTSALNKNEVYNPDLTGRKWQPWVFLDKNVFIDRMAIKKKYKAVYCHRKKTYVLADKFRKYKSVYNAKFVITQPRSDNPENGNLKYTIRLQHK